MSWKKSLLSSCKILRLLVNTLAEHHYHIHWSLARKLCSKKALLLTCKILGLPVGTWAANERYLFLHRDNLTIPTEVQLSQKKKSLHNFLLYFWILSKILNALKKKMTLTVFVLPKLLTLKTWLDKCIKSTVSEDPSTSNMVNVHKHCWSLHHRPFIIFTDHCQVNWVGKSLSYWHPKSWACLLTHWLPMKSIFFFIGTILRYRFRCKYLRNKKLFLIFLLQFWKLY